MAIIITIIIIIIIITIIVIIIIIIIIRGFMLKPQMSDIQMTNEIIQVTYKWHASTYE